MPSNTVGIRLQFTPITIRRMPTLTPQPIREAYAAAQKWADKRLEELKEYPERLPNQRYIRTFRLQAGWKVKVTGGSPRRWIFTNNVTDIQHKGRKYARFVQGTAEQQMKVHRGRWPTVTQVLDREKFDRVIQKAIERGMKLEGIVVVRAEGGGGGRTL